MKLSYYPGCSLEALAADYDRSIEAVFQALDVDLIEIDDWTCCGATAGHSLSEVMSVFLPARNLYAAEQMGLDIVSPCANCFNRLRYSQKIVRKKLMDVPWPLTGDLGVHDMTRFLARPEMIKQIKARVLKPLKGLNLVCYYGCQMVRPPRITGYDDYENPQTLDGIAEAVGARAIDWSYKATCCGASIGIGRREIGDSLTERLLEKARQAGAEGIVVSCPLCQSNLDLIQRGRREGTMPVFYFTELIRLSFSDKANPKWFKMHFADPLPLLSRIGLI